MKFLNLSLLAMLTLSSYAFALSSDSEQPVYIDSDSQQLDLKSNRVTFVGNVALTQGSIKIKADKVIVLRNPKTGNIDQIESFGELATFSQKTDDGKNLYGEARTLTYQISKDQLTMKDKAMLSQEDSIIRSSVIRYKISEQTLVADGNQKQRVSTVIQPKSSN